MARFVMTALTPAEAAGRPTIHTGIAMLGRAGDDFVCSHCGRIILQSFDIASVAAEMVYVCGDCDGFNAAPEAPKPSA